MITMNSPQNESAIDFVRKQSIFADLSLTELELVAHALQLQELAPGDYLIHEGDSSQDIYFIKHGEAEIIKRNQQTQQEFVISNVHAGDIVGEMAFIDGLPRSSSVRVINRPAFIYKLPISKSSSTLAPIYDKILEKTAQFSLSRLRTINQNFIQNLTRQIKAVEEKNSFGYFFVFFFTLYTLTGIAERFLLTSDVSNSNGISLVIVSLLFLIPTACYLRYAPYPFSDFGLTCQGMWPALKTAALIILVGILASGALYFVIDRSLFYENVKFALDSLFKWNIFAVFLYVFSSEFGIRGAIQNSLQKFLFAQNKKRAVWLTALLIWPANLYLGFQVSFIDFFINLFLGALFLRQQNLAGVVLLHFVIITLTQYG